MPMIKGSSQGVDTAESVLIGGARVRVTFEQPVDRSLIQKVALQVDDQGKAAAAQEQAVPGRVHADPARARDAVVEARTGNGVRRELRVRPPARDPDAITGARIVGLDPRYVALQVEQDAGDDGEPGAPEPQTHQQPGRQRLQHASLGGMQPVALDHPPAEHGERAAGRQRDQRHEPDLPPLRPRVEDHAHEGSSAFTIHPAADRPR
jgi:hypothetical protein